MGFSKLREKLVKISFFPPLIFCHLGYKSLFHATAIANSIRYIQHTVVPALAVEAWVPEGVVGS